MATEQQRSGTCADEIGNVLKEENATLVRTVPSEWLPEDV